MRTQEIKLEVFPEAPNDYRPIDFQSNMQFVCKSTLPHYYSFPEETKEIIMVLTDEPTEDSYLVEAVTYGSSIKIPLEATTEEHLLISWAKEQLTQFGFPCYVGLDYILEENDDAQV